MYMYIVTPTLHRNGIHTMGGTSLTTLVVTKARLISVRIILSCLQLNDKLNTDTDIRDVERDYDDLKSHNDVEEKGLDGIFEEKKKYVKSHVYLLLLAVCISIWYIMAC